jgi:hypothetical protein
MPIARHEMGHYVIATALGFRTGSVCIQLLNGMGHRGGAVIELAQPLLSIDRIDTFLTRRVQVLYAGAISESLTTTTQGAVVNATNAIGILKSGTGGAEQDYAKVRELIHVLRSIRHPHTDITDTDALQGQLTCIDEEIWGLSVNNVVKHSRIIVGLAEAFTQRMIRTSGTSSNPSYTFAEEDLANLPEVQGIAQSSWPD